MPLLAGLDVGGISVGGLETCIDVPAWKLAFDIGRCPREVVARPTILFTHAHMDHMGGVAMHTATRSLLGMVPPTYVVPHKNVEAFAALFEAWRRLDGSDLPHEVVPLGPGEELELSKRLVARPFAAPHRVHCQGYALWSRGTRLKPELRGRPQEEIRRLRVDEGREVTEVFETPELVFTGDSLIEIVEQQEVVRTARRLVMEVTFVDDRVSVEQCRSKGHVHLYEVAERAELFQNEALLLTHFSARYSAREIEQALDLHLPPDLRARTTALTSGH